MSNPDADLSSDGLDLTPSWPLSAVKYGLDHQMGHYWLWPCEGFYHLNLMARPDRARARNPGLNGLKINKPGLAEGYAGCPTLFNGFSQTEPHGQF